MTEKEILAKYRQLYPALSNHSIGDFKKSIAVRRNISRKLSIPPPEITTQEICCPVLPFFLDLEITTSCQLHCKYCARTFMKVPSKHMTFQMFRKILNATPNTIAVNLVGLGEPLLHPELDRFLHELKERKIMAGLVTNGMGLDKAKTEMLIESDLSSLTFSVDSTNPQTFEHYRAGADLPTILDNIRQFMSLKKTWAPEMTASIFSVLQADTLSGLGALAEFAASVNIPAIVISDLNFLENTSKSMRLSINKTKLLQSLLDQMREVASRGIVLLGPNILDSVNMADDWSTSIIKKPEQIINKQTPKNQNCLASWRTLVVRVDGDVNYCNCTPGTSAGKFTTRTLEEIWWDSGYQSFRNHLFYSPVPDCCRICPRL